MRTYWKGRENKWCLYKKKKKVDYNRQCVPDVFLPISSPPNSIDETVDEALLTLQVLDDCTKVGLQKCVHLSAGVEGTSRTAAQVEG